MALHLYPAANYSPPFTVKRLPWVAARCGSLMLLPLVITAIPVSPLAEESGSVLPDWATFPCQVGREIWPNMATPDGNTEPEPGLPDWLRFPAQSGNWREIWANLATLVAVVFEGGKLNSG